MPPPIVFTQPINHGADVLHNPPPRRPPGINIGCYNIRDGQNSGLAVAARACEVANLDLAVLFETKIPDSIYKKHFLSYDVVCTKSLPNQGGVGLLTKSTAQGWHVEDTRMHGPNVLSCVVVSVNW